MRLTGRTSQSAHRPARCFVGEPRDPPGGSEGWKRSSPQKIVPRSESRSLRLHHADDESKAPRTHNQGGEPPRPIFLPSCRPLLSSIAKRRKSNAAAAVTWPNGRCGRWVGITDRVRLPSSGFQ